MRRMTSGLCTAAVSLTAEEIESLENLPEAANEVLEADGCAYLAGHAGRHAYQVQVQELSGDGVVWWVVWNGPAEPDGTGYEIVALPECVAERNNGAEWCHLPAEHEGDHRW